MKKNFSKGSVAVDISNKYIQPNLQPRTLWQRMKRELTVNKYIYIMAIPVILYYLIFCYGPMFGIVIAFKQYEIGKGILESRWVGLKHFIDFFKSHNSVRVISNTFLISLYDLIAGFPAPIIFALLLNEVRQAKFKKLVQTVTYLPHFISLVVICGMITDFLSGNGVLTKLISSLGGSGVNYLGEAKYFKTVYVTTNIWQGFGWGSIIYLAALTGIDPQLYEAAQVDGANRFRQLLSVTLPGIASTIIIMLILRMGQLMSVGFEKIILLYNPSTYESADVIASYVYRRGLGEGAQYSFTTAVGLFQSITNLILLLSANYFSSQYSNTNLFG